MLYISQPQGEVYQTYTRLPVIHAFHVNVSATAPASHKIKGRALLFDGTVALKNNGSDTVTLTSTSRSTLQIFEFTTPIASNEEYNITISSQPEGYVCSVLHGSGVVDDISEITEVVVACNKDYAYSQLPSPAISPTSYRIPGGVPYGIVQ